MTKKWIGTLFALFIGTVAMAQNGTNPYGIAAGDVMLSAQGGYAISTNRLRHDPNGLSVAGNWGKEGGYEWGLSVLVFPKDIFGLGVEYNSNRFNATDTGTWIGGGWHYSKSKVKVDNLMLAMRLNANPNHRVRFYVPLGAGVDFFRVKEEDIAGYPPATSATKHYTGFAWYAGLGLESSITERLIVGLEARMNGAHMKKALFYATGIGRIGVKF